MPAGRGITGISGSFVCVSCHSGRETGEYIKSYPGSLATTFGTFNSHYLAAGGVLFRTVGYEYSGLSYSNPANFSHDTIGVSAAGTGTNGPCVECHMTTSESHLFLPTTRDAATGVITAITAGAVCDTCHGASLEAPAMTPAALNTLETQYDAALAAFQGGLNTKGICWTNAYPYFNVYDTATGVCTATGYTAWPDKDTLGAAFNMNMLKHMPMAFVHNSLYTRRLIFDSIDWLDNGALDGNIAATISGLSLTDPEKTDALAFLGGGARP
jgi:cytochrome c553